MNPYDFKDITYQKDDKNKIVILTLNQPKRKNALSVYSFYEIFWAVDAMEKDNSVGAMVITGAKDPDNDDPDKEAFSSGGFFGPKALESVPPEILAQIDMTDIAQKKVTLKMFNCEKPIIAAINGLVIGGAFTMALSGADLIYMSEHAWFQLPFAKLGIISELASSFLLPRLLGFQKAKEILYFAKKVSAVEAKELGLINEVLPHDELLAYAKKQASALVAPAGAEFAVRQMKKTLHEPYIKALSTALDLENKGLNICFNTADFDEAMAARIEKRVPIFKGK